MKRRLTRDLGQCSGGQKLDLRAIDARLAAMDARLAAMQQKLKANPGQTIWKGPLQLK